MIKKKYLILLALSGFIIAIDQVTKMYIHTNFRLHDAIVVWDGFFDITYVRNKGAAFGILRDAPDMFRELFFLAVAPVAGFIIIMIMRTLPEKELAQILALSAVFGGAIGNYIDRLRFGYVIDFIEWKYKDVYSWPAFNIADTAIVCGVMVLLIIMLKEVPEEMRKNKEKKNASVHSSK